MTSKNGHLSAEKLCKFQTGTFFHVTVKGAMYSQVKRPFQVLLFSTPLSLFIAGFLSSIANASRTFRSFIPVALSITRTLCQSMSCDPFLSRTCSPMADFSRWLMIASWIRSRCSFVCTSRALIFPPPPPHVLVLTGLAFYWIHSIPLCSTRQPALYIVQTMEGPGLVERASDSSFPGNSSDFRLIDGKIEEEGKH